MPPRVKLLRALAVAACVLTATALLPAAMPLLERWQRSPATDAPGPLPGATAELADPGGLVLPEDVARALRLRTGEVRAVTQPRELELFGSLGLDTNSLARVHARFAGEVIEIGGVEDWSKG